MQASGRRHVRSGPGWHLEDGAQRLGICKAGAIGIVRLESLFDRIVAAEFIVLQQVAQRLLRKGSVSEQHLDVLGLREDGRGERQSIEARGSVVWRTGKFL